MPGPAQQTTTAVLRAVVTMALADVVAEGPMATQLNAVMSELVQAHVEAVLLETRGLALPPPVRNSGFGL